LARVAIGADEDVVLVALMNAEAERFERALLLSRLIPLVLICAAILAIAVLVLRRRSWRRLEYFAQRQDRRRVNLRYLRSVDRLRYLIGTFCGARPPFRPGRGVVDEGDVCVHEDDWRQLEFVPTADRGYLVEQVARVKEFKSRNWAGDGYRDTAPRTEHPTRLSSVNVSLRQLKSLLNVQWSPGVAIWAWPFDIAATQRVADGFALEFMPDAIVFGHLEEDRIASMSLGFTNSVAFDDTRLREALLSVGNAFPLLLVDWTKAAVVTLTDAKEISAWIKTKHRDYTGDGIGLGDV
jgi:hypothetical protein